MDLNPFFKSVLDQDTAPVVICDVNHIIVYMNDSAIQRYKDSGGASMVGTSIFNCHTPRTQEVIRKILAWFMESPENNSVYEGPGTSENKDVYMVALRDEAGEVIGYYEKHEYHDVETRPKFWPVINTETEQTASRPLFYPGCKVKLTYPQESARLLEYLGDVEETGCCRRYHEQATPERAVIYVCNNCHEILSESGSSQNLTSVWELIDSDDSFPYPDYGGKRMALQDCWIATGNHAVHDAVRSLMGKMNIEVVELPGNRDSSRFCGTNILVPAAKSNLKLAPQRWGTLKDEQIPLQEEGEWDGYFAQHCEAIPTDEVACYCKFCAEGLARGGKTPVHLLQLLFPE